MKKKIVFHGGELEEHFPDGIEVHGTSARECLSALKMMPDFQESSGKLYQVTLPDFRSPDALNAPTTRDTIHVNSILGGSGGKVGSFAMIAIGVLAIAFATPIAAGLSGALLGTVAPSSIALAGGMLILNGIVGLLMPQPESSGKSDEIDEGKSNYLPADKNTVKTGTRIPLLYGRCKAYGHILSFQVTATNLGDPIAGMPMPIPGALVAAADSDYKITLHDWT